MAQSNATEDALFDTLLGLILGLLGGVIFGLLFAPKPGKELQDDLQDVVNQVPDKLKKSRKQYETLVDKTRGGIEIQLEKHQHRKQASRMAEAKRQEELEAGVEY